MRSGEMAIGTLASRVFGTKAGTVAGVKKGIQGLSDDPLKLQEELNEAFATAKTNNTEAVIRPTLAQQWQAGMVLT